MGQKTKGKDTSTPEVSAARSDLTPIEVQQKEFRVSRFGGYKMRDVDEFLDQVTDTFTSLTTANERLRAGGAAPMVGSPDLDDVGRQADEIIARARAEAARITGEAKAASAASVVSASGPADRAAVNAFLSREREFLQSLAGLVQEHAEAVKGMAKSARPASGRTKPAAAAVATTTAAVASTTAAETQAPSADADAGVAPAQETARPGDTPAPPATERSTEAELDRVMADAPARSSDDESEREPTRVPESETTVRIQEPAPAVTSRGDGDTEGDRSLRELFWGED